MLKSQKTEDFFSAIAGGDSNKINKLLQGNPEFFSLTDAETQDSILHIAAALGHVRVVDQLIATRPTLLETRNKQGETPLLKAVAFGQLAVVVCLIKQHNLNLNDPKQKDNLQNHALLVAATYGQQQLFDFLVTEFKIQPNELHALCNQEDANALLLCAQYGHTSMFQHLLQHYNFSLESTNKYGDNAWLLAGMQGYLDILNVILRIDSQQQNTKDKNGNNIILLAALYGQQGVIDYLQKKGLFRDLNAQCNNSGANALHMAVRGRQVKFTIYLLKEKGFNINAIDNLGNTILHQAALGGHPEQLAMLIRQHPLLNKDAINKAGQTPLMLAIIEDHTDAARRLIEYGADLFFSDPRGETAFSLAYHYKRTKILTTLQQTQPQVMPTMIPRLPESSATTLLVGRETDLSSALAGVHTVNIVKPNEMTVMSMDVDSLKRWSDNATPQQLTDLSQLVKEIPTFQARRAAVGATTTMTINYIGFDAEGEQRDLELRYINETPKLREYYHTFQRAFNQMFSAALVITSRLVAAQETHDVNKLGSDNKQTLDKVSAFLTDFPLLGLGGELLKDILTHELRPMNVSPLEYVVSLAPSIHVMEQLIELCARTLALDSREYLFGLNNLDSVIPKLEKITRRARELAGLTLNKTPCELQAVYDVELILRQVVEGKFVNIFQPKELKQAFLAVISVERPIKSTSLSIIQLQEILGILSAPTREVEKDAVDLSSSSQLEVTHPLDEQLKLMHQQMAITQHNQLQLGNQFVELQTRLGRLSEQHIAWEMGLRQIQLDICQLHTQVTAINEEHMTAYGSRLDELQTRSQWFSSELTAIQGTVTKIQEAQQLVETHLRKSYDEHARTTTETVERLRIELTRTIARLDQIENHFVEGKGTVNTTEYTAATTRCNDRLEKLEEVTERVAGNLVELREQQLRQQQRWQRWLEGGLSTVNDDPESRSSVHASLLVRQGVFANEQSRSNVRPEPKTSSHHCCLLL